MTRHPSPLERARLEAEQAKTLLRFVTDNHVELPPRRHAVDKRSSESLRGLPAVSGRRYAIPRAVAGIGPTDPWKTQRERDYKTRSGATSTCTLSLAQILAKSEGACYLCRAPLTVRTMQVEHVIPLRHGGTHTDENVAAACTSCNSRKGARYVAFMIVSRKPVYV